MGTYDLVLTGGRVIDPVRGLDAPLDVAFADGRVAEVGENLSGAGAGEVRDVSGAIVTPGLIDLHTHVYWGGTSLGVEADAYARAGAVTTLIDTGSAGPGNFAGFKAHVIDRAETRILAYLHISHAGIFGFSRRVMVGESGNLALMDPHSAVEVTRAHPETIIGIKVRLGRWTSAPHGIAPFHYALQVAETCGLPLMVHIDEAPPSYEEVVSLLRPGDVLTHCFRPFPNSPLTGDGRVRAAVLAARERGVIFDIGHGTASFSFDVARGMLANGFPPDTISSDVHMLCIDGPAFDLLTTMSKFLCLGMPLTEVVRAATQNAAKALPRSELGHLGQGAAGDASVLRLAEGAFSYVDTGGAELAGDRRLLPVGSVMGGVWRDAAV